MKLKSVSKEDPENKRYQNVRENEMMLANYRNFVTIKVKDGMNGKYCQRRKIL